MPIEMIPHDSPSDRLIDALVADLHPVRPRRWTREAALLIGLVVFEAAGFIAWVGMRPDMPEAVMTMAFWWKAVSLSGFAALSVTAALVSLDPAVTTTRRLAGLRTALALLVPVALALGWLIDAGDAGTATLLARLDWRDGVDCLWRIALLALPLVGVLGLIARRGASTRPAATATAAGLAAAGIGAFVFAFHCPHNDPLYIAVWYGGAVAMIAGLARAVLPGLMRW